MKATIALLLAVLAATPLGASAETWYLVGVPKDQKHWPPDPATHVLETFKIATFNNNAFAWPPDEDSFERCRDAAEVYRKHRIGFRERRGDIMDYWCQSVIDKQENQQ